jgi:hypothetical protein
MVGARVVVASAAMGNRLAAATLVGSIVAAAGGASSARADDEPGLAEPAGDGADPGGGAAAGGDGRRGHHQGQVGVAMSLSTGYRFIKTWDSDRYCGDRASAGDGGGNAAYCFDRTPVALDLALSYGLTRRIELMLELRFGLERDFGGDPLADGPRPRHYAPGVKFWLSQGAVNYFSTAQLAIDATGYQDAAGDELGVDVRLRNANGVQIDFHDAYGVYAYFGEQVAFGRWIEVGLEAGAGIQGRYP